jgi:hypothetical protein
MLFEYQFGGRYIAHHCTTEYSRTPLIRKLAIQIANYPDRLGPSGKSVQNSTKLTCLEITGYLIKYSTVLWLQAWSKGLDAGKGKGKVVPLQA